MLLARLLASFSHFPCYTQANWALLGLIPRWMGLRGNSATCSILCQLSVTSPTTHNQIGPFWCCFPVGGLVYILGPCWSLQWALLWAWEFLPLLTQLPQVFSIRGLRLYSPALKLWVALSVPLPSCSSLFICSRMWDRPVQNPPPQQVLQPLPWHESSLPTCPSPPLLPVWMNVSPWLSDFHTVWFSVSSGCFLFLNLLLSSSGLCEDMWCLYLHLHLGRKSKTKF